MFEETNTIIDQYDDQNELLPEATRRSILKAMKMGRAAAIVMGISLVLGFLFSIPQSPMQLFTSLFVNTIIAYPLYRLYQASQNIPQSFSEEDELLLRKGFSNLKSSFKLYAIFTLLILALFIIFGIPSILSVALS